MSSDSTSWAEEIRLNAQSSVEPSRDEVIYCGVLSTKSHDSENLNNNRVE